MSTLFFGKKKDRYLRKLSAHGSSSNEDDLRYDAEKRPMVSCSTDSMCSSYCDDRYEQNPALFQKHEIQIGSLVGEGSFCQVHEVRKVKLDSTVKVTPEQEYSRERFMLFSRKGSKNFKKIVIKQVNLKRLVKKSKGGEKIKIAIRDFALEAKVLSRLHHVNIIDMLGSSFPSLEEENGDPSSDGSSFLLLERVSETLEDKLQRWRKTPDGPKSHMIGGKILYAFQIANALQYLHEQRIIFCDLKPQNIGFTEEVVKLFDFGLCTELPGSLKDKKCRKEHLYDLPAAGTPQYMSPEMLLKQPYNEQTDVYSWAMVFHEMLTHRRPYSNCTMTQLCVKVCVMQERPSLSSCKLPSKIESLLQRSWEHEISSRVTMKSICKVLEHMLEGSMYPLHPLD